MFVVRAANLDWHRLPPSAGCCMTLAGMHAGTRLSPDREGDAACDTRSPSLACSLCQVVCALTPPLPVFLSIHFITHRLPLRPPLTVSLTSVSLSPSPPLPHALFSCPFNHFLPHYYSMQTSLSVRLAVCLFWCCSR